MALGTTGRLGSGSSLLGSIILGTEEVGALTQSVVTNIEFVSAALSNSTNGSGEDTLSFVQTVSVARHAAASASNTLAFVSTGSFTNLPVSETISFAQAVTSSVTSARSVTDTLALVQTVDNNPKGGDASNALEFVQTTDEQGPVNESVQSVISFGQTATGGYAKGVTVVQFMPLAHAFGRPFTATAASTLLFTQTAQVKNIATSTLALSQTVTVGKSREFEQALGLTQTIVHVAVMTRSVSSSIAFVQSAVYRVENPCVEKEYSPFVGTGDPNYTPPPTTAPTLGTATLTLTYPYTSPTSTLVLRNPEFRNQDSLNFNRINRETRGGTLVIYADPSWPKSQTLRLEIHSLKQSQVDDLLTFLLDSLGKEIGLKDHENRQWRGIILTPDAEISHVGRENRTVQFDFEGELV